MRRVAVGLAVLLGVSGCGSHAASQTRSSHSERSGAYVTRTPSGGFVLHNAGGPVPAIDRALLLAYGATFVDLRHGQVSRFCSDFTANATDPLARAIARNLKTDPASSCTVAVGRLFKISGQAKRGANSRYDVNDVLRSVGIGEITRHGVTATATLSDFFERSGGKTIAFRAVSGRWVVASTPHLEGAYFTCTPTGQTPCVAAGVFTLSY